MDSRNNTGTATSRRHLPNRRPNETFAFDWLGMNFVATISRFDDNTVGEIFLSNGRVNSAVMPMGFWWPGPQVPDLIFPAIWEHKALGAKGWRAIERDGLTGLYQVYAGASRALSGLSRLHQPRALLCAECRYLRAA